MASNMSEDSYEFDEDYNDLSISGLYEKRQTDKPNL